MPHKYKDQDYASWLDIPYFRGYFSSALSGRVSESTINILANTVAITHAMKMRDHHAGLIPVPDSKRDCAARFIENINKRLENREESDDWLELFIAGHDQEKKIEKPIEPGLEEELHYSDDEYVHLAALEFIRTSASGLNLSPQQLVAQLVRLQQQQLLHRSKHRAQQRRIFAGTMLGRFMGAMTWGIGRAFAKFLGVRNDRRPRLLLIPEIVKNLVKRAVKIVTLGNLVSGVSKASMSQTTTKISGGKVSSSYVPKQDQALPSQSRTEQLGKEQGISRSDLSHTEKLARREVELSSNSLGKEMGLSRQAPSKAEDVKQRKSESVNLAPTNPAKSERQVMPHDIKESVRVSIDKKPRLTPNIESLSPALSRQILSAHALKTIAAPSGTRSPSEQPNLRNSEPVVPEKTTLKAKTLEPLRNKKSEDNKMEGVSSKSPTKTNNISKALTTLRSVVAMAIADTPANVKKTKDAQATKNSTTDTAIMVAQTNKAARNDRSESKVTPKEDNIIKPKVTESKKQPTKDAPSVVSTAKSSVEHTKEIAIKKSVPKPIDRLVSLPFEHEHTGGRGQEGGIPSEGLEILPLINVAFRIVGEIAEDLRDIAKLPSKAHQESRVDPSTSLIPSVTPSSFDLAKKDSPKSHVEKLAAQGDGDGLGKPARGRG